MVTQKVMCETEFCSDFGVNSQGMLPISRIRTSGPRCAAVVSAMRFRACGTTRRTVTGAIHDDSGMLTLGFAITRCGGLSRTASIVFETPSGNQRVESDDMPRLVGEHNVAQNGPIRVNIEDLLIGFKRKSRMSNNSKSMETKGRASLIGMRLPKRRPRSAQRNLGDGVELS